MTEMTQEDVIQNLEQRYGAKRGYGCAAGIEFTINNLPYMLPAPLSSDGKYSKESLELIVDIWNDDNQGAILITFEVC